MPTPFDYKLYFQEDEDDFGGEREYWDSGHGAAGCIFIAKDTGRILLAHRSDRVDFEPHTWGTWGGKVDEGETPKDAVVREVEEETGYDGDYKVHFLWTFEDHSAGFQYHNYLIIVPNEFTPQLNWENNNSKWVEYGEWPRPMHFGLKALIKNAGEKLRRVVTLIKRKNAGIIKEMDAPPVIVHPATNNTPANYNMTNAMIVATTLYGEAGHEGREGLQAVMNVIMNRAKGDFKKAKDIVLAPKQFSMWNSISNAPEYAMEFARLYAKEDTFRETIRIVDLAQKGKLPDITGGATFYFNPKKANPSWAKKMKKTITIGNHYFYKPLSKRTMKKGKVPTVIREMIESQNPNDAIVFKKGIVGDGVWEYELRSPKSYIRYRYEPDTKTFYLDNIGTPVQQDQNRGYAKALLETFFQLVKGYGGALDTESYTTSGMTKIKHVVEQFAKQYGVRLVHGRVDESLISEAKFDFSVEGKDIPPEEVKKAVQLLYRYFKERDTLPWLLSHKWFLKEVRTGHSWIDGERYRFDYIARKGKEVDREPYPDAGYTKKMKVFRTPKDVVDYLEIKEKKYEGKYAFRGMNMAEWVSARKQGYIKSNAAYNLGNVSLTYFGSEFGTAHSYAGGFAPFDKEPTRSKPGVVIAVPFELTQDAKMAVGMGTQGERVAEKIPIDQVKGVWYIVPIQAGRGYFELVLKDGNLDRGSAAPPFSKYVLVSKMELEPNKITESIIRGREFPMKVYHGGSMTAKKPVVFVTRHQEVAQSYANERKGKIHTFMLDIKNPASNEVVDYIAKQLGIEGNVGGDTPTYEYLSPEMVGYDKVNAMVQELSRRGFDSAWIDGDFSMEDSFTEYDSFVVWDKSVLKPADVFTPSKSRVDESQDGGVYLGALDFQGANVQPVYSDDQLANHPPHMKVTDRRWRYYPELKQLDWQGKPTEKEHEGTKEFLAQRGMPVMRVHYLAGSTKKENTLLMEAITNEQAKAAIEFLKKMVAEGPFKGQVYLAGGPVRDMIMGKTPKDLDLSVVSGTIWGALKFTSWLANQMGNYKGPSSPPPTFDKHIKVDDYGAPVIPENMDMKRLEKENPELFRAAKAYDDYYAQYSNPVIFPKFGTAKLNLVGMSNGVDLSGVEVEAVSARKEVYEPGNRKPIQVLPGTLEDDVFRRDFRCNSLMLDLTTGQTHDLSGKGIEDIKNRVLVTTSNPEMIFKEDPLRMMRAVRFMVQKGFNIAPETEANIKKNASWLKFISRERVRDEIDKILVTKDPGAAFRKMNELGLLQYVSPEIKQMMGMTQNVHHEHDVFDHTMAVLANTNPELVRRRMALFHDIGKLVTREVTPTGVHFIGHEMEGPEIAEKIMTDLKYPKTDIDAVKLGILHHMKLKHGGDDAVKLSDKSLRKFKIAVGQYLEHVLDVIHADNTAHASASAMPNQIAAVRKRLDTLDIKEVDKPTLPITGDDLIAIGIKPGPVIGKILSAVTDAWYENPQITKDQAMQIAHQTYGKA